MLTLDSVIVASNRQVSCVLNDETVIMGLADGLYYGLNSAGTRIWQLIAQPRPVKQIIEDLLGHYQVDRARLTEDVLRVLANLELHQLIEVRPEEGR